MPRVYVCARRSGTEGPPSIERRHNTERKDGQNAAFYFKRQVGQGKKHDGRWDESLGFGQWRRHSQELSCIWLAVTGSGTSLTLTAHIGPLAGIEAVEARTAALPKVEAKISMGRLHSSKRHLGIDSAPAAVKIE